MNNKEIIPQFLINIINQIFEIEKKAKKVNGHSMQRNVNKLKDIFKSSIDDKLSITYHDPIGEKYNETRTDCEASISGSSTENLEVIETIKPIIRVNSNGITHIVQKAIVIVETKK